MTSRDREALIEAAAASFRARDPNGRVLPAPAFFDLDAAGREEAYRRGVEQRALEAALDPEGLSATARAVLDRIRRNGRA